jgi:hypothetical protein
MSISSTHRACFLLQARKPRAVAARYRISRQLLHQPCAQKSLSQPSLAIGGYARRVLAAPNTHKVSVRVAWLRALPLVSAADRLHPVLHRGAPRRAWGHHPRPRRFRGGRHDAASQRSLVYEERGGDSESRLSGVVLHAPCRRNPQVRRRRTTCFCIAWATTWL